MHHHPYCVVEGPMVRVPRGEVWLGQWVWDDATKTASRNPSGGYLTSPQKKEFGGKCFLTKLSDRILAG